MAESQLAVLIDMENVGLDPIKGLLDGLSDVGRVTIKSDTSQQPASRPAT